MVRRVLKQICKWLLRGFYAVTAVLVLLAVLKTVTGLDIINPTEVQLKTQRIEPKITASFNADNRTLTTEAGTVNITGGEITHGRNDLTYVLILRYQFVPARDGERGYAVLSENVTFTQNGRVLPQGMMHQDSPQELIDAQNNSILPAKSGETQELVAIYDLDQDAESVIQIQSHGVTMDLTLN